MWKDGKKFPMTPPRNWKSAPSSPMEQPLPSSTENQNPNRTTESFHVVHKVPTGDSPYVKAKHVQLIDREPSKAISLFWSAINSGDRVDSALKDMAIVMKQLDRTDEAIEAVKSFRHLCSLQSQESLDNVLIDLYKRSGRIDEHIELLQHKLKLVEEGSAFGGKRTKIARSQGKKFHVSIEQERSRLLGNLAWAYMQQENYHSAEQLYRKALSIESDKNKQCNLAICLMNSGRISEAKSLLQAVTPSSKEREIADSYIKSYDRAWEMLTELESQSVLNSATEQTQELKMEHQRSFTSPIAKDSKPLGSSINRDQSHGFGFSVGRRLEEDENTKPLLLDEFSYYCNEKPKRAPYSGNQVEYSTNFSSLDKKRNGVPSSRRSLFGDKWKKGNLSPNTFEKVPDFSSFKKGKCTFEPGSRNSKTTDRDKFGSPYSFHGSSKCPSTDPGSISRSSMSSSWRKPKEDDSDKRLIQSPIAAQNCGEREPPIFDTGLPYFFNGDQDQRSKYTVLGNMSGNDQRKETQEGNNLKLKDFNVKKSEKSWADMVEEEEFLSKCTDFAINNLKLADVTGKKSEKSWADMVEEEEFLSKCTDFSITNGGYSTHEPSVSFQKPSKPFDRWNDGEAFPDENLSLNVTNPTENLRRKLEAFDLKGKGEYTRSVDNYMYKDSTARRSLSFDRESSNRNLSDNYYGHPPPLSKKVVSNFEDYDSVIASKGIWSTNGNGSKPVRRLNRLQVFQDITLPDSPRA